MSTTVTPKRGTPVSLTAGQLPKFTTPLLAIGCLAVVAGILSVSGSFGIGLTLILGFLLFLVALFLLSLGVEGLRKAKDRLARQVVTSFFVLAMLPLVSLLWSTIVEGSRRFDSVFFTEVVSAAPDDGGGAIHAIYGTLIVTGLAALIAVPIGLFTAIYLTEYANKSKLASLIRFFVDVMTGIPSIVAGLFAYALVSTIAGPGTFNGLSGAIALSVLMIPTVVRSSEEMLRLVPRELREASYALGVAKWRTIVKIVLPTAIAGLVTGIILAIARVIGETAPLLVAAGTLDEINLNPLSRDMPTLPTFVYTQQRQIEWVDRAWTGALTLIIIVMVLNLIGRFVAWKFAPKGER